MHDCLSVFFWISDMLRFLSHFFRLRRAKTTSFFFAPSARLTQTNWFTCFYWCRRRREKKTGFFLYSYIAQSDFRSIFCPKVWKCSALDTNRIKHLLKNLSIWKNLSIIMKNLSIFWFCQSDMLRILARNVLKTTLGWEYYRNMTLYRYSNLFETERMNASYFY